MRRFCSVLPVFIISILSAWGQDSLKVSLEDVMTLAGKESLDAFKAENAYMASYWEYKSYRSGLLPQFNLRLSPVTYNRTVTQRYDAERNVDVYRPQQTLNSYGGLSVSQSIAPTGGEISVISNLNRLKNFNSDQSETYSLTPISIGITQPLFGFNENKWLQQIEPLKYQKAKQEYLSNRESIYIEVLEYYFDLLLANIKMLNAENTKRTATELYQIGQKRFDILSIDQEELLGLELTYQNAEIELAQASKALARAQFNLSSFVRKRDGVRFIPSIPSVIEGLQIDPNEAMQYAIASSPDLLDVKQGQLEAEMALEQVIRENRLSVDIAARYGLNQQSETIDALYNDLLDQQLVAIDINLPLYDWGERKGKREMALRKRQVAEIELTKAKIDFEQGITLKVVDFNLQGSLVKNAARADTIAMRSYDLTEKRFRMGQADVLKLTTAMQARQQSLETYISSLKTYWQLYFEIRKLTLFDFTNGKPLSEAFEEMR